jgi:glycosyltransferase involved in cell wall biosynthesis
VPAGYRGLSAVTYHGQTLFNRTDLKALRGAAHDLLYRYSARKADCVFTVSQAVKDRVVGEYRVPQERVVVSHLAPSEAFRRTAGTDRASDVRKNYLGTDDPFILFVGKLSDRHFIPELLEAFANTLRRSKLPHRMLLVGPDALNPPVKQIIRAMSLKNHVIHVPFIPHLELPPVYSAAELFVYPASSVEGFGIPVLEAMACGTPVISTNQGSISEFARGSALLVENSTVSELSNAIELLATNSGLRQDLRLRGLATADRFKWKVTAEQTMNHLWQTAQRKGPKH